MNKVIEIPTLLCTPFEGGFYMGRMTINGDVHAIIAAPKAEGERSGIWIDRYKDVPGAKSFYDGMSNTIAMADAGSELAQWALSLTIGGKNDWHLPSQDELELLYRAGKPTTESNSLYSRSGINVSAIPPTYPYTPDLPLQTSVEAFRLGGAEAFEDRWYWTSTQHADDSDYAWCQYFGYGTQNDFTKDNEFLARAVRSLKI